MAAPPEAHNLHRRHLKVGQKAAVAQGLVRLSEQRRSASHAARGAQRLASRRGKDAPTPAGNGPGPVEGEISAAAQPPRPINTPKAAALLVGVSFTSIRRVDRILQRASELHSYLLDGRLSIPQAVPLSRASDEQRKQVIEAVDTGACASFAEALKRFEIVLLPTGRKQPSKDPDLGAAPAAGSAGPKRDTSGAALPAPPPVTALREYGPAAPEHAAIADYPSELLSPMSVVMAIREVYGSIHLDPCSTAEGQQRVGAKDWYGADQDGLSRAWQGPVHVFPPGRLCRQFAEKLRAELERGLEQATFVADFDLGERWVRDFLVHRHFSAFVVSRKPVEFDQVGQPARFRAPLPVAVYLFGTNATPEQLARAFGFWGRVLVNARER